MIARVVSRARAAENRQRIDAHARGEGGGLGSSAGFQRSGWAGPHGFTGYESIAKG